MTSNNARLEHMTREWFESTMPQAAHHTPSNSTSMALPPFNDFPQPDTLWMINLLASNTPLLQTAARLFMHLRAQYERKKLNVNDGIDQLRDIHEKELAIMLGMTDTDGRDVVVNSQMTQSVFERHSAELTNAVEDGDRQLQIALKELRSNFLSFFCVAAPDVVGAPDSSSEAAFCQAAFSSLRCPIWFGQPASRLTTVRIVNPLRGRFVGARPKDPSLSSIVMDIAPLSLLGECLPLGRTNSFSDADGGNSTTTSAGDEDAEKVQIWFRRLATNRNHVLWVVGDDRELRGMVGGNDEPELLLDSRVGWQRCDDHDEDEDSEKGEDLSHARRPHHHQHQAASPRCAGGGLRMKCSTSVWGGNFIFHWDPTSSIGRSPNRLARRVLHHALAWNVDGLAVAFGQTSASQATVAQVLAALHEEIANCQMDSNCTRPQHDWCLHYAAVRQMLPDFSATVGPVPSASGKASFNLPFGVTVFVADASDVSGLIRRIFDGDAEIVV